MMPRVCIAGPLPPPSGGMANQTRDLAAALRREGLEVDVVRTNAPVTPMWLAQLPVVRAGVRLARYLPRLWRSLGRCNVLHLMANSGLTWFLVCAPAIWLAAMRGVPVVLNYRGGFAREFFARRWPWIAGSMRRCARVVVPSEFLRRVFAQYGMDAEVIPNFVDLCAPYSHGAPRRALEAPRLVVTRHLEEIYDVGTSIRAFARVRERFANASMTVAGDGPQRAALEELAHDLGLGSAIRFVGNVGNEQIPSLLADATVMVNSSRVDNMPVALIEAMAARLPIVSSSAGGIPDLVSDGETALLVNPGDHEALADAICRISESPALAARLTDAAERRSADFRWPAVRDRWMGLYAETAQLRPAFHAGAGST